MTSPVRGRAVPVLTREEAAALIPTGAVVSVSSSSGLGCPDAVLSAIGERFAEEGAPGGLTMLHPIAAGDMYGIGGIDHLAAPGLISRIIAGSYPSGPSSLPPPKIWDLIESGEVAAYNFPSGVLFQMHRAAAAHGPGVLTEVGLDTFVDPRHGGGRMNDATPPDFVQVVEFDGREWLYFPSINVDVAIIRGTTADEVGNLTCEEEGAPLGVLDHALAARANDGIVIAQVKRVAAAGSLPAQHVRVPGTLVDYVVVDPEQAQTTQTPYLPEIAGVLRRPVSALPPVEWTPQKVIARRAAMELRAGDVVNLGFGISSLVPHILVEEGLGEAVTWVIEQGLVGGVPLTGFQFGCAMNPEAVIASPDQFTFFQGGGFECTLLSFLEVAADGSVNVSRLGSRPHVTAGAGGFIDITARAPELVFSGFFTAGGANLELHEGGLRIVREGRFRKFVAQVEQVTFNGERAVRNGQRVTYVTERCVLRLTEDGLVVTEVAPGIDVERDVLAQADAPLQVADGLREMDERLFRPEPLGLELADPPAPHRVSGDGRR